MAELTVDLHSHLIPNIDDGSQSIEQSVEMILKLKEFGVKKIITTPHVHPRYPNTPLLIRQGLSDLQEELSRRQIKIQIEAAAEYYVDEEFSQRLLQDDTLLSFGDKYVLVEAPFQTKPIYFDSVLFDLKMKGYNPVLAHPERYRFLEGSLDWILRLRESGVLMQVTIGSISGYYGTIPAKIGSQLLKLEAVDFLGSDLHRFAHLKYLEMGLKAKEVRKAIENEKVKNATLL